MFFNFLLIKILYYSQIAYSQYRLNTEQYSLGYGATLNTNILWTTKNYYSENCHGDVYFIRKDNENSNGNNCCSTDTHTHTYTSACQTVVPLWYFPSTACNGKPAFAVVCNIKISIIALKMIISALKICTGSSSNNP